MTPAPLTYLSITSERWISARTWTQRLLTPMFWQSDASITRPKQRIQSWKFIFFYPSLLSESRGSVSHANHGCSSRERRHGGGWRRVRLLTSLRTSVASIERGQPVITEGSQKVVVSGLYLRVCVAVRCVSLQSSITNNLVLLLLVLIHSCRAESMLPRCIVK